MGTMHVKQMTVQPRRLLPPRREHLRSEDRVQRLPEPGGWLQFEAGWLDMEQTLKNLETAVSLLQRTSEGLSGIDQLMDEAVIVVNTAWSKGDKSHAPPPDLDKLVGLRLAQINEIVRQCRFHGRGLLDGQSGVAGHGIGVNFVRGGASTRSSPPEGYAVDIHELPSRAMLISGVSLDDEWVRAEKELFLAEGEHFIRYRPGPEATVTSLVEGLRDEVQLAGLDLEVGLTSQRHLIVRHNQYGSQYKFKGCSFRTPLLSKRPGKVEWSQKGRDIQGSLGGESAFGIGRMLIGYLDNENTSELSVVWRGDPLEDGSKGTCYVVQNAISFQDTALMDGQPVYLALPTLRSDQLGCWMDTPSGFDSLASMRFETWQELRDALHLLYAVSFELEDWKERVEGWIKRYQNQALACLRKSRHQRENPGPDERVTSALAEQMAQQLKELIQGGFAENALGGEQ